MLTIISIYVLLLFCYNQFGFENFISIFYLTFEYAKTSTDGKMVVHNTSIRNKKARRSH